MEAAGRPVPQPAVGHRVERRFDDPAPAIVAGLLEQRDGQMQRRSVRKLGLDAEPAVFAVERREDFVDEPVEIRPAGSRTRVRVRLGLLRARFRPGAI